MFYAFLYAGLDWYFRMQPGPAFLALIVRLAKAICLGDAQTGRDGAFFPPAHGLLNETSLTARLAHIHIHGR